MDDVRTGDVVKGLVGLGLSIVAILIVCLGCTALALLVMRRLASF